jgi:hypothetical protein
MKQSKKANNMSSVKIVIIWVLVLTCLKVSVVRKLSIILMIDDPFPYEIRSKISLISSGCRTKSHQQFKNMTEHKIKRFS